MLAAMNGKLDCLEHLTAKGANVHATNEVSAAPPAPPPSPPAAPAALPSPPPLTTCCAAAAPPQDGRTALMEAAFYGQLDCLDPLITKGANLEATDNVSAAPPAAPTRLRPCPSPSPPAAPAAPPSPPPLTACGAAAAPPQNGWTALMHAAAKGKLDCFEHLVAKGANLELEATDKVSAAPPAAPTRLRPRPSPSPPAAPAAPPSPPPLTVCCAAAAPPQGGDTALIKAAYWGKLDCLEHLITKGAKLEATDKVSAAPPAAPTRLRPRPPPSPPAAPAAPPSSPPLTACGAATAPPQEGDTALTGATLGGNLDCLEHLIAKGANLEATTMVSDAQPAARGPLRPSPSAQATRRPCCPALTTTADRAFGAAAAPL